MTKENEVNIMKSAECPSLSGNTTVSFSIGWDGKNVMLKIDSISSSAIFNSYWVNVKDILDVFNDAQEPFSSSALHSTLFKGQSVNTACLYTSIAKHLKLIATDPDNSRKFVVGSPKEFLDSVKTMNKPPSKKKLTKDTTKKPSKRGPKC